jgi:hypothetical protein
MLPVPTPYGVDPAELVPKSPGADSGESGKNDLLCR